MKTIKITILDEEYPYHITLRGEEELEEVIKTTTSGFFATMRRSKFFRELWKKVKQL